MRDWLDEEVDAHEWSDDVPKDLREDPAFRDIFAQILSDVRCADAEGLGAPWGEDAERTALYVWRRAREPTGIEALNPQYSGDLTIMVSGDLIMVDDTEK